MDILIDLIHRGGWVMYPLLLCSLAGLGLICERLWALRRGRVIPRRFLLALSALLDERKYEEAALLSRNGEHAAARLAGLALKIIGRRRAAFKDVMEEAGRREAAGIWGGRRLEFIRRRRMTQISKQILICGLF